MWLVEYSNRGEVQWVGNKMCSPRTGVAGAAEQNKMISAPSSFLTSVDMSRFESFQRVEHKNRQIQND